MKGYVGRVMRDIQRQMGGIAAAGLRQRIQVVVVLVDQLLRQKPEDKGKLYALHESEVYSISKAAVWVRYEFGTKVSVATTHKRALLPACDR